MATEKLRQGFTVSVERRLSSGTVSVEVYQEPYAGSGMRLDRLAVCMMWYANDLAAGTWYTGDLTIERANAAKLTVASKILAKVEGIDDGRLPANPLETIAVLRKMKMVEGVWDARVGDFLPLGDVSPAKWRPYMAWTDEEGVNYHNLGEVLAPTEEEARFRLTEKVAQSLATHHQEGRQRQALLSWLAAPDATIRERMNCGVRITPPDARPAERKLDPADAKEDA